MLSLLAFLLAAHAADPVARPDPTVTGPNLTPRARDTDIGWERPLGVGVSVGLPTGVTAKLYLDRRARHALEASVAVRGLGLPGGEALTHVTAHTHLFPLVSSATLELPLRVGAGPFLGFDRGLPPHAGITRLHPRADGAFAGIRGVVGADLDLVRAPVQFYLDFSPYLSVAPSTHLSIGGTLGARYYF